VRYNRRGDLCAGVAGGVLSINRVAIGFGGGPKWLNDHTLLANALVRDRWALYQFDRTTNWQPALLDERGATRIGAGGGNWAATLASTPPVTYGEVDGEPLSSLINLLILDGWQDGSLIFCDRDYMTLIIRWPDGSLAQWPMPPHINLENVRMAEGGFCYLQEPRSLVWQPRNGPSRIVPTVDVPFEPMTWQDTDGWRWWLYHNDATYLQYEDTATGWQGPASYGPDAWFGADGLFQVATTPSAGELPDTITLTTVHPDTRIPLAPPVPSIGAFAWPVYIAPFSDPDHRSGCPVNVDNIGILCETADELPTVIRQAEAEHKRVCFIWDHPTAPVVPPGLRAWDQVWIEAYRLKTETLEQSAQRWWANLLTLEANWPGDSGIIPMFYCQGGAPPNELWTVPEVLEANARVPALLNTLPRVKVAAPFAYDRLNGITAHPPLQTRLNQYQAASPGVPVLVPIPPIPPPDVADSRLLYSLIERRTSRMTATRVVGGPMLKASGGGYGVILNNPIDQDYLGLPPKNTVLQGGPASGQVVLTVTPSGDFQCRDKNAIGSWETGTPSGGFLVYTGDGGQRFLIPFAK